jgi:hypothetical protein
MHERIGEEECKDPTLLLDNITSMSLNSSEDMLYFITKTQQLMKVNVSLDGTDPEETTFSYVHE